MPNCKECGTSIGSTNLETCPACGEEAVDATVKCPYCGSGNELCDNCARAKDEEASRRSQARNAQATNPEHTSQSPNSGSSTGCLVMAIVALSAVSSVIVVFGCLLLM